MKKFYLKKVFTISLAAVIAVVLKTDSKEISFAEKSRKGYEKLLQNHNFSKTPHYSKEELKKIPKYDRPDLAWEQDFLMTMNPATGVPEKHKLFPVLKQMSQANGGNVATTPGSSANPWVERGPDNVGGRTRAIMFDPNDATNKKVWVGGVTGGLWYNNDITDANSTWQSVDDFWDNIAVTCIAADPNNSQIFYVGTGEGWGAGSSRGAGVWKTSDGGTTWNQLASTTSYNYVNDLVVRDDAGTSEIYVGTSALFYRSGLHGTDGLYRSTDGGAVFTQVMPIATIFPHSVADIEIAADNRIWIGTRENRQNNGGGKIMWSDDGTTWTTAITTPSAGRVEVAVAPSDANYVYALIESGNALHSVIRTTNKGVSWLARTEPADADNGIPNTDFSRGQAWYDLILQVNPTNRDIIYAGGVDLFTSADGGGAWNQISKWSNNNNLAALPVSLVHADQHNFIFRPGSSTEVVATNDGGVYYTSSIATAGTANVFSSRNNGYNVTQYYSCAIDPTAGSNSFLAGSQDNGTQQYSTAGINSTVEATGGDGGYCFIDQNNPLYQITSFTFNQYTVSDDGGVTFPWFLASNQLIADNSTGLFINPATYDNNRHVLYTTKSTSEIYRVRDVNTSSFSSPESVIISGMSDFASHLRVSPHTTSSTTLYVGSRSGELYKVTNADVGVPTTTNIGTGSFPNGAISCVDIGPNENTLIVTFANYSVSSIWLTTDGGTTWLPKEGNLPDMPVRWVLFNPNNFNEAIIATEIGVWSTTDLNAASPTWTPSNSGLANVRVDMLQMRDSDNEVIAATHGRGLFSSSAFSIITPSADFMSSDSTICETDTITFTDLSLNTPTSWEWTITPNTITYVNSTNANSQNPDIRFDAAGTYDIKLKATNSSGSDSLTNVGFITVNPTLLPTAEISTPDTTICSGTNITFTASVTNEGATPTYQWLLNGVNVGTNSNTFSTSTLADNDTVAVILTSSEECAVPESVQSDSIIMTVVPNVTPSVTIIADNATVCATDSITFTATPTNGGIDPSYQWKINNTNVGTDTSIFKTNALVDNDSVWVIVTSNETCLTQDTAISDSIIVTVNPLLLPVVSISTPDSSVCIGDNMIFTATPTLGGTTPVYQWTVNGINMGTNSPTFSSSSLSDNDTVRVIMTSSEACISDTVVMSDSILVTIHTTLVPDVTLSASDTTICTGDQVFFTATTINGGVNPTKTWFINGNLIVTGQLDFNTTTINNNDTVTVVITSTESCASPTTDTASLVMTVNPLLSLGISISSDDTTICQGTTVTFTASPTNGGTSPMYQWSVNGANIATGNPFVSSTLNNGDQVRVIMTSSEECTTSPSILSTPITMIVSPTTPPAVSIAVSPNDTVCSADPVTFTATPSNAGTNPAYQWKLNGVNVGTNSPTYSPVSIASNDVIVVEITSSEVCASTPNATSNAITMEVTPSTPAAVSITADNDSVCGGTSITFTATPVNGGLTPNYQWKVNGSNVGANSSTFTATLVSNDVVTVEMTSSEVCADPATAVSNQIQPFLYPAPLKPVITKTGLQMNSSVAATKYQWYLNGNILPNDTLPSIAPVISGSYTIEITDANGCKITSDPFNFVYNIGLNEYALNSDIRVFPNPNNGITNLLIDSEFNGEVSIMVTDVLGNVIHEQILNKDTQKLEYSINITEAANGMYFVQVLFDKTPVQIEKFIKE